MNTIFQTLKSRITNRTRVYYDMLYLNKARNFKDSNYIICVCKNQNKVQVEVQDKQMKNSLAYDFGDFEKFADWIKSTSYTKSTYANVKNNSTFKKLYQFDNRNIGYIHDKNFGVIQEETGPCMVCGIVLPIRLLSIDHKRPQTGGYNEAILKVFRVMGLTKEGPQGPKGIALQTNNIVSIGTKPTRQKLSGTSLDDRYTLNDKGIVFYSLAVQLNENILEEECMHNLVNLAPLCQFCNSSRSNATKY